MDNQPGTDQSGDGGAQTGGRGRADRPLPGGYVRQNGTRGGRDNASALLWPERTGFQA